MIERSATFKEKTKYSQEKYIKKKQQKWVKEEVAGWSGGYPTFKVIQAVPSVAVIVSIQEAVRNVPIGQTVIRFT